MIFEPGVYHPGCIVAMPTRTEVGVVSHKGILSDRTGEDALPMVIHNARLAGEIVESTMTFFLLRACGFVSSEGYPSEKTPKVVLERARSQIGRPWKVWYNCEHFARWVHELPIESRELRRKAVGGGLALFALAGLLAQSPLVRR
jgi:hypothetical protein